jgi:hypothetical protein
MSEQLEPTIYSQQHLLNLFRLLIRLIGLAIIVLFIVIVTLSSTTNILEWIFVLLPFVWFPALLAANHQFITLSGSNVSLRPVAVAFDRIAFYTLIAQAIFLITFALVPIIRVFNKLPPRGYTTLATDVLTYSLWVMSFILGIGGTFWIVVKASRELSGSRLLGGLSLVLGIFFIYQLGTTLIALQSDLTQRLSLPTIILIATAFHLLFSLLVMHFLFGPKVKNREFLLSKSGSHAC